VSSWLYLTRLFWQSGRGVAKLHGKTVKLEAPPQVAGMLVEEIDYIPEIGMARVRCKHEGWRDMLRVEIAACDAYLANTVNPADSEW
jgi:hypothetical protein